jgi:hypothetical protein
MDHFGHIKVIASACFRFQDFVSTALIHNISLSEGDISI